MKEIMVGKILGVNMISYLGTKWEELRVIVEETLEKEDKVHLNFEGVSLVNAYDNDDFKELVTNENVTMTVYGNSELVTICDGICRLDYKSTGRVKDITEVVASTPTKKDRRAMGVMNSLRGKLDASEEIENDVVRVRLDKMINQLENVDTATAIMNLIVAKYKSGTKVIVDLGSLVVGDQNKKVLAAGVQEAKQKGIDLSFDSEDNTSDMIHTIEKVGENKMNLHEKMVGFKKEFELGDVGILSKFKRQRGNSFLNRLKDDTPIFGRVAIFRGYEGSNVVFQTFNNNTFFRSVDYVCDNDGEELESFDTEIIKVPMAELGFSNKCVGISWHFNEAIQFDNKKTHYIYTSDENGRLKRKFVCLPEYIYMVLCDHGVPFTTSKLLKSIALSRKYFNAE